MSMQFLAYALIYPIIWLISKLPFPVLYFVSDCCYVLVYRIIGYRKKVVRNNLKTAFPEKTDTEIITIEKKFYHHLCDMFLEMTKSLSITKEELDKRYVFENIALVADYNEAGQSANIMMGHYASYEWVFAMQFYLDNPGHAIYKPIANPYFDKLVHKIRRRWNTNLIPAKETIATIKKHQEEDVITLYGFAGDQSPKASRSFNWAPFLNYELPFATGCERTAKEFNFPVIFLKVEKLKRGYYKGTFETITTTPNETSQGEITADFAHRVSNQIIERPELYLWTHKRFKHLGKKEEIFEKYGFKD